MRRHKVLPRDRATFTARVYEIFEMVFDRFGRFVRHFYICSKCDEIIQIEYDSHGNAPLRRHLCFKNHLKKHPNPPIRSDKQERQEQMAQNEFLSCSILPKERKMMAKVFALFTKLCVESQPTVDSYDDLQEEFESWVPTDFELSKW